MLNFAWSKHQQIIRINWQHAFIFHISHHISRYELGTDFDTEFFYQILCLP